MKTNMQAFVLSTLCTSLSLLSLAQEQRAFNQNASRSNHTRLMEGAAGLTFSPVYTTSFNNSNDSLLFRGSGAGIKLGGDYFWGKAGLGFATGFTSSSPDDNAINKFLNRNNIPTDLLEITKSNQQNMFLLIGPSLRFGNTVEMLLHAKGGLFVNNGGVVSIQQKGAQRAAYRNESTGKSVYPGFLTGLNIQYNTKSEVWSFGIGADYVSTKTEVNNYDARRAGGVEALKLSKNVSDLMAGVTVRYNINSARRVLPTVNKREMATAAPGCGAVTVRTTEPDGTVSEASFACVDDAIAYQQKKVTVKGWDPEKKEGIKGESNPGNLKAQNNNTVKSNRGTEFAMSILDADTDGDGEYESSYLSASGEIASITIDEPGKAGFVTKRSPAAIKTVRCPDGTCRIISSSPNDFPASAPGSIKGSPISGAEVWFTDAAGKIYKSSTDGAGNVNLSGLPSGTLGMALNMRVEAKEDIIISFNNNGTVQILKTSHDIAMNSIRNMK